LKRIGTTQKLICTAFLISSFQGVASASTPEAVQPTQARVDLLEKAFASTSAKQAIDAWAKALQQRNGALQYALLSKELRAKYYFVMGELHWVTGSSGPSIEHFSITEKKSSDSKVEYSVDFAIINSGKEKQTEQAEVSVEWEDGKWVITSIAFNGKDSLAIGAPYAKSEPYMFEEKDYLLTLPSSWKGKIRMTAEEKEAKSYFLYSPNDSTKEGVGLFAIERIPLKEWEEWGNETGIHTYLGEKDGIVYALVKASENPFADQPDRPEYAEFEEMLLSLDEIVHGFALKASTPKEATK
jgi:hypothetical protein